MMDLASAQERKKERKKPAKLMPRWRHSGGNTELATNAACTWSVVGDFARGGVRWHEEEEFRCDRVFFFVVDFGQCAQGFHSLRMHRSEQGSFDAPGLHQAVLSLFQIAQGTAY